jgi:hypothetical protein
MKKVIVSLVAFVSLTAHAQCNTHTFIDRDGKVVVCSVCCVDGNCNSVCV